MTYTDEPWSFHHSRISWWIESPTDKSRQLASGAIPADIWNREKKERDNCGAIAIGTRIVACKNACDGISNAALDAGVIAELVQAARYVIAHMTSTYKARNGRDVGIQGDDGEKCWIVHSDDTFALEDALAKLGQTP